MTTTAEAAADASLTAHIKFTNISGLITMHVLPNKTLLIQIAATHIS